MTRSIALSGFAAVAFTIIAFLLPYTATAQTNGAFPGVDRIVPQCGVFSGKTFDACTFCDFMLLAQNLLNFALFLAIVTAGGLFAWAGWLYATRAMKGGNVQKAHSIFISVFIGLILVMGAYAIVDTLMKMLAGGSFLSNWNNLCPSQGYTSSQFSS